MKTSFQIFGKIALMLFFACLLAFACEKKEPIDSAAAAPKPVINEIAPKEALPGALIEIKGVNMDRLHKVLFGKVDAAFNPTYNTEKNLLIRVPAAAEYGKQLITILNAGGEATQTTAEFLVLQPEPVIEAFAPLVGVGGDTITLTGTIFNNVSAVKFGTTAAKIIKSGPSEVKVTLPELTPDTEFDLSITTPGGTSIAKRKFKVLGVNPTLDAIEPIEASPGEQLTIKGTNFGKLKEVKFGSLTAKIISAAADKIVVEVPAVTVKSQMKVEVITATGQGKSSETFTALAVPFVFFGEGLENAVQNWSWAKVEANDESTPKNGKKNCKVTYGAWSALWFNTGDGNPKVALANFKYLRFWVHGGKGKSLKIKIFYRNESKAEAEGDSGIVISTTPGEWQLVSIPIDKLGKAVDLSTLIMQEFGTDGSSEAVYFDDVRLQ
jgi:IPT/TIG domain